MIDKDWRNRFKTLSERLEPNTAHSELTYALSKFKGILSPVNEPQIQISHTNDTSLNVDDIFDKMVDEGLDVATLVSVWLNK